MSMSKRSREEEATWCTIESDPGIFTLLIEKLGVKGVQVEEIYDLESLNLPSSVFGFIFLFKWSKESSEKEVVEQFTDDPTVFFAKQEISNACATQAILHILLNLSSSKVKLGNVLDNFKSFAQELPADMKGLCLSNSLEIRQIHNEFGNLEGLLAYGEDGENEDSKESKDPFHFVAFVHKNDKIFELDGLKESPIVVCDEAGEDWKVKVLEIIKKRVGDATEIRFNLMALVADRRQELQSEMAELTAKIEAVVNEANSSERPEAKMERSALLSKRFDAQQELEDEEAKWSRYRKDWVDRQKAQREMQSKPKISQAPLSSQVQDLLKSMTAKGLIPK